MPCAELLGVGHPGGGRFSLFQDCCALCLRSALTQRCAFPILSSDHRDMPSAPIAYRMQIPRQPIIFDQALRCVSVDVHEGVPQKQCGAAR